MLLQCSTLAFTIFQISKQGRVTSKVLNDDHDQLICHLVVNDNIFKTDSKYGQILFIDTCILKFIFDVPAHVIPE